MQKTIGIIVAIIVVIGLGFLLSTKKSEAPSTTTPPAADTAVQGDTTTATPATADATTFTGSPTELAKRGGNYKCTVDTSVAAANTTGTVYVSGSKISGAFTSSVQGKSIESHMVMDGGYNYVWTSAYPQGMKIKIPTTAPATPPAGSTTAIPGMEADDQNYSYKCEPWTPDSAVFTLPTSVKFMEMSNVPGMPQTQ